MPKKRVMPKILHNSKSQAAVFLIGAAMIMVLGLLYFAYQKQAAEKKTEIVQPELVPIKSYIEDCIRITAEDGLQTIGLTGGYINLPAKTGNDPRSYLATFPASGFKIPYWRHDGANTIPSEDFINQQLRGHIKNGLRGCINDFEPFKEQFEIYGLSEPVVDVKFNDNDVSVRLKHQIEVISKNGEFRAIAEDFSYVAPIRLKKAYELAKLIMERENKDSFLERKTIDLYSMDTSIPTTDFDVSCKTKSWQLSEIKTRLTGLLRVNLPYIRIKGTDWSPSLFVQNPEGKDTYANSYFQRHYVWEIDKDPKKFSSMKVAFTYDSWPMEIYARPSQNGILKSNAQKGSQMLKFFCLNIWHFTYDIEYPVLVTVFDQETEKNKAYRFNFAFKVDIDHNLPNKEGRGAAVFETAPDLTSEEFCDDAENEITIFTVDNSTGNDISGVNLTFACGRHYCDIGQTSAVGLGAASGTTKRLPYCVLGVVRGAKEGYAEAQSFVQTDVDGRAYVLWMNPVKEFQDYKVVKHLLSSPGAAQELSGEKASIIIQGKDNSFESFAAYPKEADLPLILPVADAAYEVSILLIDGEKITGGYIGEWKAGKDAVAGASQIVFHAVAQGPATEDEKALFAAGLGSYSKKVPAPELK